MQELSLEMWMVLIAASSVLSLFSGEMLGAWRMKRLMSRARAESPAGVASLFQNVQPVRSASDAQLDPLGQLMKAREFASSSLASVEVPQPEAQPQPQPEYRTNDRAQAFSAAQRPAPRYGRFNLDAYEDGAKPDPGAAHILNHYEKSFRMLDAYANGQMDDSAAGAIYIAPGEESPRISDVAPVSRTIDAESLQSLRTERTYNRQPAWVSEAGASAW
ncbi:hypothetical protein MTsPCn3_22400 [Erythrobacter sp. MTPC3]